MNIGLFFGSFNPIHIGHMAIANYMVEFGPIEQLWFVVTPQNPLKKKSSLLHDFDRFDMVRTAIADDERFQVTDIEFHLPKPSYTIDTLTYLSEKYPTNNFVPIIGGDNYETLCKWKNHEELLNNYQFMVYPRPGCSRENFYPLGKFIWVEAPLIEISSTFIRQNIAQNHDIRHFLPSGVYKHIKKMGFYTENA